MFGFRGSGQSTPKGNVFDIEELRQLVLDFQPPAEGSSQSALIPLASGTGFTTGEALSIAYARLIQGRYGKIPVAAVEKQLDVNRDVLFNLLRGRKDFMMSKSKGDVITRCDQERILEELFSKANSKFILASDFANQHDLEVQSVDKLVRLSEETHSGSPLQLLDAPGQSRTKSLENGQSYVHALSTLLELKRIVVEKCKNAHTAARVAVFSTSDMFGLDIATFIPLAHKLAQEFNGVEPLYGFFEGYEDEVRYVTKSYLLRKAKKALKEVAIGNEAFCDLNDLVQKYSTLLPNVEAGRQLARTECLHKDGSKYKWHFISHYAIGDVGLNSTATRCLETLGPQRYLNTQPFVQAFPPDIQKDVLVLLQNRTIELWRYCGGEVLAVLGLEEWLVLRSILVDIEFASKRLGRVAADDVWKKQVARPSLVEPAERDAFLQKLSEESDLPMDLQQRLWNDERVKVKAVATMSFDERIAELNAEQRSQVESIWKSRAYMPAKLYDDGLHNLEDGQLKEQLQDLLAIHLAQDLVPSTLKRMRHKGLLRDQSSQKQASKLEAVISADKKEVSVVKSLDKFHEKLGFAGLTAEELTLTRDRQLTDMAKGMETDIDGPRSFLTLILIILAVKKAHGVIYATGKFAPRLLKLLKPDLSEEQFKDLERLKDTVKSGKVTEEDRAEMKKLAAQALEKPSSFFEGETS